MHDFLCSYHIFFLSEVYAKYVGKSFLLSFIIYHSVSVASVGARHDLIM